MIKIKKINTPGFNILFCALFLFVGLTGHALAKDYSKKRSTNAKVDKEHVIRSEAGLNIPKWGVAIDAVFDPRLDDIIPDYHIVNLVITNRRAEPILLDAKRDRWIVVDSLGKKHIAANHVKFFNKKLWPKLPEKLKQMIDYPHQVGVGKSVSVDVFIPKDIDLFHFKEVVWKSHHFSKEFNVFTNYEDSLSIPGKNELNVPKNKTNIQLDDSGDEENSGTELESQLEEDTIPTKYQVQEDDTSGIADIIAQDTKNLNQEPNLDDLIIIK